MTLRSARIATSVVALALAGTGLSAALPLPAAPGDGPTLRVVAAGDFAANTNTRAVLSTMAGLDPDVSLALGDLSYGTTGAEQAWCDLVTQYVGAGEAFELLAGNHEANGQNGNINDFSACLPNQLPGLVGTYGRQWYVDVPASEPLVRLVMISPGLSYPDGLWQYTVGSPRYAWTEAAIDGARTAAIPWVVVGMHKPCLSVGIYGCESGADLMSLLVTKKVDLVLSGHEHSYQRTHQLGLGAGCAAVAPGSTDPDCVVDADAAMVRGAGTVFATVGTGGQSQREITMADPEAPYFAAASGLATATWGALDLQLTASSLTASFVRASGGTFTDGFTLAGGGTANLSPTAASTVTCTELTCAVDGSASSDPDGTIAGYAWSFGDGATAVGAAASHTYASAGSYAVTLTVTDDDGATGVASRTVTPTSPPGAGFALDDFGRTVVNGLGSADTGGVWRTTGSAANYAVTSGTGRVRLPSPGMTLDVSLPAVSAASTDLTFALTTDKPATGGGLYVAIAARRVAGVGEYRANLRLRANGVVALGVARTAGTTETALAAPVVVPGLTFAVGDRLQVRVQAAGTSPTTVRARVWKVGTTEPTTWQTTATDATVGLQVSGAIGVNLYLSSSTTNTPVVVGLDDLTGRAP